MYMQYGTETKKQKQCPMRTVKYTTFLGSLHQDYRSGNREEVDFKPCIEEECGVWDTRKKKCGMIK